jgi:hypothetical protein
MSFACFQNPNYASDGKVDRDVLKQAGNNLVHILEGSHAHANHKDQQSKQRDKSINERKRDCISADNCQVLSD